MILWVSIAAAVVAAVAPGPASAGREGAVSAPEKSPLPPTAAARAMEPWAKTWGFRWDELAFVPDPKLAREARNAWSWLVPGRWRPILCATVGGIFFETEAKRVGWLDIGAGTFEEVAPSAAAFEAMLRSGGETVEFWFLPALVEELHRAGKRPGPGQAYYFLTQPVFDGKFVADNLVVVPIREQIGATADIHRQIAKLPDGTKVRVKVR